MTMGEIENIFRFLHSYKWQKKGKYLDNDMFYMW